jgi:hypothetical protein
MMANDGTIHNVKVNKCGVCMLPERSGLEGVRPCIPISETMDLILLDFDPNSFSNSYKGRILEYTK